MRNVLNIGGGGGEQTLVLQFMGDGGGVGEGTRAIGHFKKY